MKVHELLGLEIEAKANLREQYLLLLDHLAKLKSGERTLGETDVMVDVEMWTWTKRNQEVVPPDVATAILANQGPPPERRDACPDVNGEGVRD